MSKVFPPAPFFSRLLHFLNNSRPAVPVPSPHDPLTLDFSVDSCIAAGKAAAPYALHGAVSGAAWGATLLLFQTTAAAARLSCAMPVISPTLGMIGICAASAASNQVLKRTTKKAALAVVSSSWKSSS